MLQQLFYTTVIYTFSLSYNTWLIIQSFILKVETKASFFFIKIINSNLHQSPFLLFLSSLNLLLRSKYIIITVLLFVVTHTLKTNFLLINMKEDEKKFCCINYHRNFCVKQLFWCSSSTFLSWLPFEITTTYLYFPHKLPENNDEKSKEGTENAWFPTLNKQKSKKVSQRIRKRVLVSK